MKSNNKAILLIEFQKQWTENGLYNFLIKNQLNSRNVLENTKKLVEKSRKNGIKIIHAPLVIDPNNKKGWFAKLTFGKVFTKGKKGSEISEGLFKKGDLLIKGRYAFDAFIGSNLEEILRENNFEEIFVCGFTTDQCVSKTLKTLINKKFNGTMVTDCTATINGFLQKNTEKKFKNFLIKSEEIN